MKEDKGGNVVGQVRSEVESSSKNNEAPGGEWALA